MQNKTRNFKVNSECYHNEINNSNAYVDDFVNANIEYVESLAKIQKKYEMVPDFLDLYDRWDSDMCLENLSYDVILTSPKK